MKIICQSCGMPILKPSDFGTESDGTSSAEYCIFCLKQGKFSDEGISLEEKIVKVTAIGVSHLGMEEEEAKKLAESTLPFLKRWSGI